MKKAGQSHKTRSRFMKWSKIILLLSGIILLGFTSCHVRHAAKYGGPPADYKQMDKAQ